MRRHGSRIIKIAGVLAGIYLVHKYLESNRKKEENRPLLKEVEQKQIEAPQNHGDGNHRQKNILNLIKTKKILTPSEIYKMYPDVSTRTLRRDMEALIKSGKIVQNGTTKSTIYKYKE